MPSFTFVSTANAYALRGAVPVFVDIRPDTLNLDERLIEAAITERTKAIVVVHYAGVGCEMDEISAIAARHGLAVIEDNAHGLGGTYHGRPLGSLGVMATQSFHVTKNIQCGEGGALVLNDAALLDRAEIIREKGTNRSQFFRGHGRQVQMGGHRLQLPAGRPARGRAHRPAGGLRRDPGAAARRLDGLRRGAGGLGSRAAALCGRRCRPTATTRHTCTTCCCRISASNSGSSPTCAERGVMATFHYVPLHSAPAGEKYGRVAPDGCPVTDEVSARLVRLPLFAGMTPAELDRVIAAVLSYRTLA